MPASGWRRNCCCRRCSWTSPCTITTRRRSVRPTSLVRVAVACRLADHLGYWVVRPPHHDARPADASELIDGLLSPLPLAHRVTIVSDLAEIATEVAAQVDDVGELLVP